MHRNISSCLVRPAQLGDLPLEPSQLGLLIRAHTRPDTGIDLGLAAPLPQRLVTDAELARDLTDRFVPGPMVRQRLLEQPQRALPELRGILTGHTSILLRKTEPSPGRFRVFLTTSEVDAADLGAAVTRLLKAESTDGPPQNAHLTSRPRGPHPCGQRPIQLRDCTTARDCARYRAPSARRLRGPRRAMKSGMIGRLSSGTSAPKPRIGAVNRARSLGLLSWA